MASPQDSLVAANALPPADAAGSQQADQAPPLHLRGQHGRTASQGSVVQASALCKRLWVCDRCDTPVCVSAIRGRLSTVRW